MASPASVSTPGSAASPPALAPAPGPALQPAAPQRQQSICIKPLVPVVAAGSPAPGAMTPTSITTKEWVIPPRPKPGRKPATDTPPTKRKAQNRAAQRAFRERRAARVGELEEQIKQTDEEHERELNDLQNQVNSLKAEVERATGESGWWKERCHLLERDVAHERAAKDAAVNELRALRNAETRQISTEAVPLPRRSPRKRHTPQVEMPQHSLGSEDVPMGCGGCSTDRCQCIDDAFNMGMDDSNKRAHLPSAEASSKRQRSIIEIKTEPEEMEIDFTARFSSQVTRIEATASPAAVADPCGFCSNGTPCICAEMAAQEQEQRDREEAEQRAARQVNRLAPIRNMSQFTPPPSEGDVSSRSDISMSGSRRSGGGCGPGGPGTCAQCQSDPNRTLFCKTLAASRARGSAPPDGCCGGGGPGGGCCKSGPSNDTRRDSPSITLSCADTYTTLSRHPNFARASDEPGKWMPKLHTLLNPIDEETPREKSVGVDRGQGVVERRPAMEVEAASVMGVLRYFDRRFLDD